MEVILGWIVIGGHFLWVGGGGWGWVYIFLLVGGCGWGWLEVYFGGVWVGNIFYRWLEWVGNGGGIFWVGGGGGWTFLWVCRGGWGE